MGEYRTAVCDMCGSEDKFTWIKPEGWYSGRFDIYNSFDELDGTKGNTGVYCSKDCMKKFIGSFFNNVQQTYINQFN